MSKPRGHRHGRAHQWHGEQETKPASADAARGYRSGRLPVLQRGRKRGRTPRSASQRRRGHPGPQGLRKMNALIRERCDIVLNNSTGCGVNGDMI